MIALAKMWIFLGLSFSGNLVFGEGNETCLGSANLLEVGGRSGFIKQFIFANAFGPQHRIYISLALTSYYLSHPFSAEALHESLSDQEYQEFARAMNSAHRKVGVSTEAPDLAVRSLAPGQIEEKRIRQIADAYIRENAFKIFDIVSASTELPSTIYYRDSRVRIIDDFFVAKSHWKKLALVNEFAEELRKWILSPEVLRLLRMSKNAIINQIAAGRRGKADDQPDLPQKLLGNFQANVTERLHDPLQKRFVKIVLDGL